MKKRMRNKPAVILAQIQVRYMYGAIIVTSSLLSVFSRKCGQGPQFESDADKVMHASS